MCARFCRECGAPVSEEANFCTQCGFPFATFGPQMSANNQKAGSGTVFRKKAPILNVPDWNDYYPSLTPTFLSPGATEEQKAFFAFWKDNFEKGTAIDIEGNLSYLFLYAYYAIFRFAENKDILALFDSFGRLQKHYSDYEKLTLYLDDWKADAWLCLNDYESAWQILRKTPRLKIIDILNIRSRCSDSSIDGHDLLGVLGKSGLTKFGREHREEVANCVTIYLADVHQRNGKNFVECFNNKFNSPRFTETDVKRLEPFFPKEDEFKRLKWEWQFEQRHPKPKQAGKYLFSGVPFPMQAPFRIEKGENTDQLNIIPQQVDLMGRLQLQIASIDLPKIVERALFYEMRKIVRTCEKMLKDEAKRVHR